ncbi:MAG: Hsp20/alpha crystallin family protein [Gammaproteobacteria bacterium]|nr:Hsp20/alpha crystallin family protein [Gammaproteobacteria bacterium]
MSSLRPFNSPLNSVDSFQQLVDNFFGRGNLPSLADAGFNMPATDISESAEAYNISAELPGIRKEDIKVSLHDGVLAIEAESKSEHEEKGDKQIRTERRYGKFVRRFTLGNNVNEQSVQAKFEDGVLKLTIPKQKEPAAPKPKSIPVG